MESWFTSSFLFSAAQNYLLLHQRLLKFSKFHKKLSQVGLSVLQRHTWYLTEELVPLSLFSNNISIEVQHSLAQKISTLPASDHSIQKPSLPVITAKSSLPNYVDHAPQSCSPSLVSPTPSLLSLTGDKILPTSKSRQQYQTSTQPTILVKELWLWLRNSTAQSQRMRSHTRNSYLLLKITAGSSSWRRNQT